jgi:hypothetical protein
VQVATFESDAPIIPPRPSADLNKENVPARVVGIAALDEGAAPDATVKRLASTLAPDQVGTPHVPPRRPAAAGATDGNLHADTNVGGIAPGIAARGPTTSLAQRLLHARAGAGGAVAELPQSFIAAEGFADADGGRLAMNEAIPAYGGGTTLDDATPPAAPIPSLANQPRHPPSSQQSQQQPAATSLRSRIAATLGALDGLEADTTIHHAAPAATAPMGDVHLDHDDFGMAASRSSSAGGPSMASVQERLQAILQRRSSRGAMQ